MRDAAPARDGAGRGVHSCHVVIRELKQDDTERIVSPVRPQTMTNVIRDALRVAGYLDGVDVNAFSSHSAKRGIATELAQHDADVRQIMSVTDHKSANVALGYVKEPERFSQSPLRLLDL